MAVCDQWRFGPRGGALGLDWPAVEVLLRVVAIPFDVDRLDGLRVMEGAVLEAWAERSEAASRGARGSGARASQATGMTRPRGPRR